MTKPLYHIRQAMASDATQLAPLIYEAIEDVAHCFTASSYHPLVLDRLAALVIAPGTRFYYGYATVAVEIVDGTEYIIGLGTGYKADALIELTQTSIEVANRMAWGIDDLITKRLLEDFEGVPGTYYIDHLAVCGSRRGSGVGKTLLSKLFELATRDGFNQLSILADCHNPRALALYRRLGFQQIGVIEANGHRYHQCVKEVT